MTYAFVEDLAASWESYEGFAAALEEATPDGLIVHAAGRTDEGFRIIEVWESEVAWRRWADHLGAAVGTDLAHVPRFFRDLRPAHLIVGRDASTSEPEGR